MKISKIIYIISLIGMFIYAAFYGGRICYALLYLFLLIPVFSLIYIIYVNQRMRFYQITDSRKIIKLQTTSYLFKLQNESLWGYAKIKVFFDSDVATLFPLGSEKEYSLPPESKFEEEAELICRYCGTHSIGVKAFAITDYFGLFTIRFPLRSKLTVCVLPRIIPWVYGDLLSADEDEKRQNNFAKSEEERDAELRPLVSGDSLKNIHWKASAKQQKLMVHKYITIQRQEICVFPDFVKIQADQKEIYRQQDLLLELLLSLCNTALQSSLPVHLSYSEDALVENNIYSQTDFDTFYEYSSTIKFDAKIPIHKILSSTIEGDMTNKQIFVITSALTKDLSMQLLSVQANAKKVTLLLTAMTQSVEGTQLIKQLVQRGIAVKEVSIPS